MADNGNVREASKSKPKSKKTMGSRKQFQQRMKRRQQKKEAAAAQAVATSQTTSDPAIESTEPSQEVPVTSTPTPTPNGVAAAAPTQTEAPQTPPQEPANAWEKKKAAAPRQAQAQPPRSRPNGDVARPTRNGHPSLQIPTRPPQHQQQQPRDDRAALFNRKAVPQRTVVAQPPKLESKFNVRDRLQRNRNPRLVEAMPDDYVAPDRRRSPRKEQMESTPVRPRGPPPSARPTNRRPESETARRPQQMPRRQVKNGRMMQQNGSSSNGRPELRQTKPTRTATRQVRNGSSNRPSSSTSSPSSRRTTSSSSKPSMSKSPSTATSSTSSSPIRRAKKDLRKVGMKKVTNGKRIIKKPTTVWLDGSISDPALQPSESKLNPEAPLFETSAILTETGNFLNDDYYRATGMMMPMTQPVPQIPVAAQTAVTPTEPDFSQAANNFPSYQMYPDMFGSGENYYNYAQYSMYPSTDGLMSGGPPSHATHVPSQFGAFGNYTPTDFNESYPQFHSTNHPGSGYYPNGSGYPSQPAAAYSGATPYIQQNGMASGVTTGTTSVSTSQDFSQMMAPTHVPNGVHTNGSVAVINGNTAPGTSSTSADLTGVSSSAVSESGANPNESSMNETFMYDNSANGYYAASATM